MQTIDIDSWPRRDIYKFYSGLDYPHFNICAEQLEHVFYNVVTPDQYPLSLNALRNGCNQKSNRDPVLDLGEAEDVLYVSNPANFEPAINKDNVLIIAGMGDNFVPPDQPAEPDQTLSRTAGDLFRRR